MEMWLLFAVIGLGIGFLVSLILRISFIVGLILAALIFALLTPFHEPIQRWYEVNNKPDSQAYKIAQATQIAQRENTNATAETLKERAASTRTAQAEATQQILASRTSAALNATATVVARAEQQRQPTAAPPPPAPAIAAVAVQPTAIPQAPPAPQNQTQALDNSPWRTEPAGRPIPAGRQVLAVSETASCIRKLYQGMSPYTIPTTNQPNTNNYGWSYPGSDTAAAPNGFNQLLGDRRKQACT